MARLKTFYKEEVAPALRKIFSDKSVMQIPKLDKIVINVGAGEDRKTTRLSTLFVLTFVLSPDSSQ